jgi:WD40 repeat protein
MSVCARFELSPKADRIAVAGAKGLLSIYEKANVSGPGASQSIAETPHPDRDAPSWQERRRLNGDEGEILDIDFVANGELLLTSATDGNWRLWDLADGSELFAIPFANEGLSYAEHGIDCRNDGTCLVALPRPNFKDVLIYELPFSRPQIEKPSLDGLYDLWRHYVYRAAELLTTNRGEPSLWLLREAVLLGSRLAESNPRFAVYSGYEYPKSTGPQEGEYPHAEELIQLLGNAYIAEDFSFSLIRKIARYSTLADAHEILKEMLYRAAEVRPNEYQV